MAETGKKDTRSTGKKYEDVAALYLEKKGCRILDRNYRNARGELDIVAAKDGTIIFLEVKYRRNGVCGDPLEAVDTRKQRRISRTALYYLTQHGYGMETPCRFDVIAVYGDTNGSESIRHVENAFEFRG